jgi:hypothetical protein
MNRIRPVPKPPLPDRIALGWGKIRRAWLITCRPDYVRRSLARRQGQCDRTGACCRLMVNCPSLGHDGETHRCATYLDRGPNCSLFPIDERDLRDRDRIMPERPCGYHFIPVTSTGEVVANDGSRQGKGNGNARAHATFPWEVDGSALGGRIRRTNAFSMACAFLRTAWTILRESRRNGNGRNCGARSDAV